MRSAYYKQEDRNVNDCFLEGINESREPYTEYIRYWHGSAAVVRLMHLFTDIKGIRVCATVLVWILTALLILLLVKYRRFSEAVCTAAALASVSIWFVTDCIQNTWCVVIMLIVSPLCVILAEKGKYSSVFTLLFVSGIVTAFFDFLTTETMTILFPLLLVISIKRHKDIALKEDALYCIKCCFLWFAGFCLMWMSKWLCAAVVLDTDVMPYVTGHIEERLFDTRYESTFTYLAGALTRNIGELFPFGYTGMGTVAGIILVIALCFYVYVFRRDGADRGTLLLFAALGAVVYIRYLVLHNHSYLHYFFTYRAQVSAVLAAGLICAELTAKMAVRPLSPSADTSKRRRKNGQKT